MNPGMVIYWRDFQFDHGGRANKLFIILNDQRNGEHVALIVTSQEKRGREQKPGCHAALGWFFIQKGLSTFAKPTWVTLDGVYEFRVDELDEGWLDGTITEFKVQIRPETLTAIVNCFRQSRWVTDHHKWLLEPATK